MADSGDLRVSDQEREDAARQIREHYAAGRLDDDELSSRVEAVYAARTRADLGEVRAGLPPLPPSPASRKAELAARRSRVQRQLVQQTGGGLGVFAVCTAIWLIDGASGQFWPVWILLVAILSLVRNGWRLYGPAPEIERVEADLAARRARGGPPAIREARRAARHTGRRGRRGR